MTSTHSLPHTSAEQTVLIDARRLLCPLPVIRVQQAVDQLPPGTRLSVYCTDPGALYDIPAWVRIHGHRLLETRTEGPEYIITLQVEPN